MHPKTNHSLAALIVMIVLAALTALPAHAQQCEDLIKMDGLFTKARTE